MIPIRPARPTDEDALLAICLKTGDAGQDATSSFSDPEIPGLIFALPYLRFEPDCAFVAEDEHGVCGYILGAPDSARLAQILETHWWPPLRARYPKPAVEADSLEAIFIRNFIHAAPQPLDDALKPYPAHLHVDLLPRAQGKGLGRRLMETLFQHLRDRGVPGIHWGVDGRNAAALAFYRKLGAQELQQHEWGSVFGQKL